MDEVGRERLELLALGDGVGHGWGFEGDLLEGGTDDFGARGAVGLDDGHADGGCPDDGGFELVEFVVESGLDGGEDFLFEALVCWGGRVGVTFLDDERDLVRVDGLGDAGAAFAEPKLDGLRAGEHAAEGGEDKLGDVGGEGLVGDLLGDGGGWDDVEELLFDLLFGTVVCLSLIHI